MLKITKKIIGKQGGLEIPLFKLQLGKGKRKISIISGLHGDETSGLLVLNDLIKSLKKVTLKQKVDIFPLANILGTVLKQREDPINNQDLNRKFPGNINGNFSERLTGSLIEEIKDSQLVIDLHTFESNCPTTAILMGNGSNKVKQKSIMAIKTLQPQVVWELDLKDKEEIQLSGSLGPILHNKNIANFAIEMPPNNLITKKQIKKISQGLKRIVLNKKLENNKPIPVIKRQKILANTSGIFIAKKKILDNVNKNEVIGKLNKLPEFKSNLIKSEFDGFILTLKNNCLVNSGMQIGVIAKPVRKL